MPNGCHILGNEQSFFKKENGSGISGEIIKYTVKINMS